MVAAAKLFLRQEEDARSPAKVSEAIAVSTIAVASASAALIVGVPSNLGTLVFFSVCLVFFIVSSCIAVALTWSLTVGRTHVVQITDAGIEWDGRSFGWHAVRQIRWRSGPPHRHGMLTFTVARRGLRSRLALPVRVSASTAAAVRTELRAFLSSSGYYVRWID